MRVATVVVGAEGRAAERTAASVAADPVLGAGRTLLAAPGDPLPWSTLDVDAVALLRSGDEVLADATPGRLAALDAGARATIAGHRLRRRGRWGEDVLPPPVLDPAGMLLRCPVQLGAVLARLEALPDELDLAPDAVGGDVALLATLAAGDGLVLVPRAAVVVRTSARHGLVPDTRLAEALALCRSRLARSAPTASALRRRALTIAFLDVPRPCTVPATAADWFGPATAERTGPGAGTRAGPGTGTGAGTGTEADDVLEDLLWALGRQAERLASTVGGLDAIVADGPVPLHDDIGDLHAELARTGLELQRRHHQVDWLHREVADRDRQVAAQRAELVDLKAELVDLKAELDDLRQVAR